MPALAPAESVDEESEEEAEGVPVLEEVVALLVDEAVAVPEAEAPAVAEALLGAATVEGDGDAPALTSTIDVGTSYVES